MIIFYFILVFIVFMVLFLTLTKKYVNPYKLIMIFGKKGSGKSTTLTKLALKYIKNGWTVYSTEYIPFTYFVPAEKIGFVQLEDFNYVPFDPSHMCMFRLLNLKNLFIVVMLWQKRSLKMKNKTNLEISLLFDYYSGLSDKELILLSSVFADKALSDSYSVCERNEFIYRYQIVSYELAYRYIMEHK